MHNGTASGLGPIWKTVLSILELKCFPDIFPGSPRYSVISSSLDILFFLCINSFRPHIFLGVTVVSCSTSILVFSLLQQNAILCASLQFSGMR